MDLDVVYYNHSKKYTTTDKQEEGKMFVVRFVRKDGKPDEEYYYHTLQDAEAHKRLFDDDDSDLYERIEIVEENF